MPLSHQYLPGGELINSNIIRMKRTAIIILLLLFSVSVIWAQSDGKRKSYVVGFYNLENLFDVYDDPVKNDEEFLPDGKNQWTEVKYEKKLHNMATVIKSMAESNGRFHSVLGVSEIENRLVLEDLVSQPEIASANYQIVHYDGPDARGVDVGLLYRPDHFHFIESESIPFDFKSSKIEFSMDEAERSDFKTRDILMVYGLLDGEEFAFYVAHLPSRIGGKGWDLRSRGAEIIYDHASGMMEEHPGIKIVVMGDMNDNPTDVSMSEYMHGKESPDEVGEKDFFSPFYSMLNAGYGSLAYRGVWNIYDIILVNETLLNAPDGGFKIKPLGKKGFYGVVYKKPFMITQRGQYKGTPFRTFSNGAFIGGYSDHFPTYIVLSK